MARNITYLLGAGASYHSIPVVEQLNKRMELFLNMATPHQKGEEILEKSFYKNLNLETTLQKYQDIVKNALKHKTVDTYAKKLFLQRKTDELQILKEFLCLYFAFEQSIDNRKIAFGQSFASIPKDALQCIVDGLYCHLDYRYDVFLASLLDKNMKLPSNINIISWNYDHQFELAYMDYAQCNFNEAKTNLKIYPHEKSENGQIVKLNGSANQIIIDGEIYNFESHNSKNDFYFDSLNEITRKKSITEIREYALNFAWEGTKIQKRAIALAQDIMENTNELIIIGYSFPYFNRNVDIDIIGKSNAQSIKVQCLEGDFRGIKQSLVDIFGDDFGSQIHFHDDLSQFYIPSVQFSNNNN